MEKLARINPDALQYRSVNHKLPRRSPPEKRKCIMSDVIGSNDSKTAMDVVGCKKLSFSTMFPLPKIVISHLCLLHYLKLNIVILFALMLISGAEAYSLRNVSTSRSYDESSILNSTLDPIETADKPPFNTSETSPSIFTEINSASAKDVTSNEAGNSTIFDKLPAFDSISTAETLPTALVFTQVQNTTVASERPSENGVSTPVKGSVTPSSNKTVNGGPKFAYFGAAVVDDDANSTDGTTDSNDSHVYAIIKSRNETLQSLNDLKRKLLEKGFDESTDESTSNINRSNENVSNSSAPPIVEDNVASTQHNAESEASTSQYSESTEASKFAHPQSTSEDIVTDEASQPNNTDEDKSPQNNSVSNSSPIEASGFNETDSMIRDVEMGTQPDPKPSPEFNPDSKDPKSKDISDESEAFAEPAPVWEYAKREWGIFWHLHIYGFGGLFLLLAIISFFSMIRISTFTKLLSRQYFITLDFLMFVVCASRAFYLFYDPYNSFNSMTPIVAYFIFNTGFPFFTAAFAVLFLSLLQATRLQMLSPRIQRPSILATIIAIHFIFSIATDIIVGTLTNVMILLTVCQIMFITWALLLAIAYFYIFKKLHRSALFSQSSMMRTAFTNIHVSGGKWPKGILKPNLSLAVKLTLVCAVFAISLAGIMIYGMTHVVGLFVSNEPHPWPWWTFQTAFRALEVGMCAIMIYIGSRPLRQYESKTECLNIFRCCRKKREYRNVADLYPSHFSAHLQPIIRDPHDIMVLDENHSVSLPGYGRANYVSGSSIGASPKAASMKYMSAPLSNASVISAISNQKTNSFQPTARSDLRSTTTLSTASGSRPSSMLIKDNGFIRFRRDSDSEENMSDIDETRDGRDDGTTSQDEVESMKPQIGSVPDENALNDDISYNTSPFFRNGYKPYYNHRISYISGFSGDTTDIDGSDEQLSDLPAKSISSNTRLRKCGSTCSSESAGNSFDISMFLRRSVGVQTNSVRPISASYTEDGRYRPISAAVTDDDDGSSVDGHENMIYTRPETTSRPEGLDLTSKRTVLPPHVINSPMQDITPDSAVYLDLHIPKSTSPITIPENIISQTTALVPVNLKQHRYQKRIPCSQSMNDLTKRAALNSPMTSYRKFKKSTESLLSRLKGSTFSLNASLDGYKLLKPPAEEEAGLELSRLKPGKLRRTLSERRHRANKPKLKSAKYMSVCGSRELEDQLEARFLEDVDDGGDSGAGGSKEDIEMADEGCQTDPVVIIQDKISEMCTAIKHLGDERQPILDVAAS